MNNNAQEKLTITGIHDNIDKTPLKSSYTKQKLKIKGDVAYLKTAFLAYFLSFFLSLFVYGGWGLIFYGLYDGLYYIDSNANILLDIFMTLLLLVLLLLLTIGSWVIKRNLKKSAYIYRLTGEIKHHNNENNYTVSDILCIQLLNYEEKKSKSKYSDGGVIVVYEINLVAHTGSRFTILRAIKEKSAFSMAEKLSVFMDKPHVNHITT